VLTNACVHPAPYLLDDVLAFALAQLEMFWRCNDALLDGVVFHLIEVTDELEDFSVLVFFHPFGNDFQELAACMTPAATAIATGSLVAQAIVGQVNGTALRVDELVRISAGLCKLLRRPCNVTLHEEVCSAFHDGGQG